MKTFPTNLVHRMWAAMAPLAPDAVDMVHAVVPRLTRGTGLATFCARRADNTVPVWDCGCKACLAACRN